MKKILFVVDTINDAKTFEPVIEELKRRDGYGCLIIADESLDFDIFQKMDTPYKFLENYKTKNAKNILEIEKPNLIVVGNDSSFLAMLFTLSGKSTGIPSLFIPHGIIGTKTRQKSEKIKAIKKFLNYQNLVRYIMMFICSGLIVEFTKNLIYKLITGYYGGHSNCTKICVFGNAMKKTLVDQGINPNKIVITGQPRFDILLDYKNKNMKKKIYSFLNLSPQTKLILLITQPFVEDKIWTEKDRERFVSIILDSIKNLSQCQLVLKIHPRENIKSYHNILKKVGAESVPIIKDQIPLYELLNACNLMMTVSSTTALEAMILDKPVITVNFSGNSDLLPYAKFGAAIGVYKKEELVSAIKDALYNEKVYKKLTKARKKFIYEHTYLLDGKSSERIAKLIIQMIEESRRKNDRR